MDALSFASIMMRALLCLLAFIASSAATVVRVDVQEPHFHAADFFAILVGPLVIALIVYALCWRYDENGRLPPSERNEVPDILFFFLMIAVRTLLT